MKAAGVVAAALAAIGECTDLNPTDVFKSTYTGTSGLNEAAKTNGKYMGTASNIYAVPSMLSDPYVMAEFTNTKDWGMVASQNLMRIGALQPNQGNFTYEKADLFVSKAKELGYKLRCHTLQWHQYLPDWITKSTWTNATLLAMLGDHITNVMTHFGDDCYAWDVITHPFADSTGYRTSIWYQTCGESYITHAFNVANEVKTKLSLKVKLYISEYSLEWSGSAKATFAQTTIKGLLDQGVKIDGVAFEGHFEVGQTPSKSTMVNAMKVYTDVGLDVAVTQLDIRVNLMPPSMDTQQEQATNFASVVSACVDTPKCVGVTVWDFLDSQSWIPSVWPTRGWALLFYQPKGINTTLVRKGAYDSMMKAWSVVATTEPPETGAPKTDAPTSILLTSSYVGTIGLNDAAMTSKKYMGFASDVLMNATIITDKFYMAEFRNTKDWGMITPSNLMHLTYLQETQGTFTYTNADIFVSLAKGANLKIRCHALVWHDSLPEWLVFGSWTNATLLAALGDHITNVMTHFKDDCYAWDVVNEVVSDTGSYRDSFWYKKCGASYIAHAFNVANQVKTKLGLQTKLYYNDYGIEWSESAKTMTIFALNKPSNNDSGIDGASSDKTTFAQNMVKGLLGQGVKIDGIGMQSHFEVGATPSKAGIMSTMKFYTDLGLDVAITALEIRTTSPAPLATQQQQVIDYATVVGACKETARCVGVSLWEFDDTYSSRQGLDGKGWAMPFYQPSGSNSTLVRKGSYDGILQGWGIDTNSTSSLAAQTGSAMKWGQCHLLEWLGVGAASAFLLLG